MTIIIVGGAKVEERNGVVIVRVGEERRSILDELAKLGEALGAVAGLAGAILMVYGLLRGSRRLESLARELGLVKSLAM